MMALPAEWFTKRLYAFLDVTTSSDYDPFVDVVIERDTMPAKRREEESKAIAAEAFRRIERKRLYGRKAR